MIIHVIHIFRMTVLCHFVPKIFERISSLFTSLCWICSWWVKIYIQKYTSLLIFYMYCVCIHFVGCNLTLNRLIFELIIPRNSALSLKIRIAKDF